MNTVEVRPCSREDIERLEQQGGSSPADMAHHRERRGMQELGEAWYLLAWQDGAVVGRVTLLKASKYADVRARYGGIWEMNALEAFPRGRGVGTLLIKAAEDLTSAEGPAIAGLAYEPGNFGAKRLYERLGYSDWGQGPVLDEWTERDVAGRVVQEHRTGCSYLVKALG